jgi:NADH-quinone oxidoreductase subunit C
VSSIDNNTLKDLLTEKYGTKIDSIEESYGILDVFIKRETLREMIVGLRDDKVLDFNFLTTLCGIHFPEKTGSELDVVYHLHSLYNNVRLRLHVLLSISDPVVPTISDIFSAANWLERETFEFYGVKFDGHPDLRIILNVEDMDYHPLLKQYQLTDATRTDKEDKYFGR